MRILLVEDNPGDARLLVSLLDELNEHRFEIVHRDSLNGAVGAIDTAGPFDVALLDLSLPDGSGRETFLRVFERAPQLPIVVLTGLDDEDLAVDLAHVGAQDYLVKGTVDGRVLHRSIRYAVERKKNEQRLRLAAAVFESALEGIMVTDGQGRVISANRAFVEMSGYSTDDLCGRLPDFLQVQEHEMQADLMLLIRATEQWRGEIHLRRRSGEVFPTWLNLSVVKQHDHVVYHVAAFTELTALKLSQERLRYLAYHDVLTGLPNRALFMDRLTQVVAQADRNGWQVAVMFIDMDRFKIINDSLGHGFGDMLLAAVAERLGGCIRGSDTAARLGGDEFAIILSNIHHIDDAERVAGKIIEALTTPFYIEGQEMFVTVSIGIAFYSPDDREAGKLVEKADLAMYRAKELGRNNYQFYSAEMDVAASQRFCLEKLLRRAIANNEFLLYYQPQIDARTGRVAGVEALLRWRHPDKGVVTPNEFIDVLEETGLIVQVGEWVLREACCQAMAWRAEGLPSLRMAVNLSVRQLKCQDLTETVARVLGESGFDAAMLDLEITETAVIENLEEAMTALTALKALGVGLAIDDFGSGSSSLRYLKRFPIDSLKICHAFVLDVTQNRNGAAIVSSLISLAATMQLNSIAEGVETEEQLAFLRSRACDQMQGFLFSRPLPVEEMASFLRQRQEEQGVPAGQNTQNGF